MTGAYPYLTKEIPTSTLFYAPILMSVAGSAAIQFGFQIFFFYNVQLQPFYVEPAEIGPDSIAGGNTISYENTVLFMISNFQYLVTAVAFSVGKPFRKSIFSNWPFLISLVGLFIISTCLVLVGNKNTDEFGTEGENAMDNYFFIHSFTTVEGVSYYSYRGWIFLGIVLNITLTLLWEKVFIAWVTRVFDARRLKQYNQRITKKML
jgi:magnesium-transporting ATPase (P-type)